MARAQVSGEGDVLAAALSPLDTVLRHLKLNDNNLLLFGFLQLKAAALQIRGGNYLVNLNVEV